MVRKRAKKSYWAVYFWMNREPEFRPSPMIAMTWKDARDFMQDMAKECRAFKVCRFVPDADGKNLVELGTSF